MSPPGDGKVASSDQEDALKPKTKGDQEPIAKPEVIQLLPQGGMSGLPMTDQEINALAWTLYQEMRTDPDAQPLVQDLLKYAAMPEVLLGSAFMAGVVTTLLEIRSRQSGEGRIQLGNN